MSSTRCTCIGSRRWDADLHREMYRVDVFDPECPHPTHRPVEYDMDDT